MISPHGPFRRVIVIVLDSVGVGELPDAGSYGDRGSNTVGNIAKLVPLKLPTLRSLGFDRIAAIGEVPGPDFNLVPGAAVGRMAEASAGKDSVTGHWEMMGIVLERAFPTVPNGFSADVLAEFSRQTGRGWLGNKAASGTQIIDELGAEHMRTGALIVYTSADSVFQIAAHEEIVPIPELYRGCEIAYTLVGEGLGVGRVIARPVSSARRVISRGRRPTSRLRAAAVGRDAARSPQSGVAARRRHRQDRGFSSPAVASRTRFIPSAMTTA